MLALSLTSGGGVAITFEQFFSAIAEQESSGSYSAVGPQTTYGRAYGKYQVLESNIPGWTKAYYGRSLTTQQFLNNPQAQEAVARGKLKSYWNKYGARGAAAAWYGGPGSANLHMSTRPQQGGPSIKDYVDSVLSKAAKYPAGGSPDKGSKTPTAAKEEARVLARDELAEQYGFVDSLFDSNPELKKLFNKAVSGQWTTAKFQAELRDTKWWKTHSGKERDYLMDRYGDPATAKQNLNQAFIQVRQLAGQLGIVETPALLKKMNTWAYNVVAKGWNDSQLRYEIGKFVTFKGDKWQGQAGEVQEALHEYAYNMGVTMSGGWYANNTRAIIRGVATQQDMEDVIRRQAKATYSQWSKQIDAGQTVADIASPYFQSMAQILELPAGSINLFDGSIKKALQYKDPQTGANSVKPLWQFENELRADPRWKKTKNAQDSLMQVAHQVLADFGFKY
jgi:hypothetical protein